MVSIKSHSGIYTLEAEQQLPMSLEEAWEFFSSPENLVKITPDHMNFRITSGQPKKMHTGQIISYKVSPFPGINSNWVTEITHVDYLNFFVDEQRYGPYSMWHHEHIFEANESGVLMRDKVSYKLPLGLLGRLMHPIMVKKKLMQIFQYRFKVLDEMFGT